MRRAMELKLIGFPGSRPLGHHDPWEGKQASGPRTQIWALLHLSLSEPGQVTAFSAPWLPPLQSGGADNKFLAQVVGAL